jgi:hypothetical protein
MRMMKRNWGLWTLGVAALGVACLGSVASAVESDVSTERSGSIVVFPKVVWDGTRDTIIQISNTGNPMVHAHCFYVNAAPQDPFQPPSVFNPPQWNETDFDIWLTKQQPTHWVVSTGRRTDFFDGFGNDGSGLDPGLVPPVPLGFRGELKCVQTDSSGAPSPGNKLKGEATLRDSGGDVSEYNAIAFQGNPNLSGADIGSDLELTRTAANPGEYSACPNMLLFNHFADGLSDPVLGQEQEVTTTLTLVPCQEDFENQIPGRVTVQFQIIDEFEVPLSASTTVDCWLDLQLSDISSNFRIGHLATPTAFTRINPVQGAGGVIGIAEETRRDTSDGVGPAATAAFNLNVEGNRYDQAKDLDGNAVTGVTDHIVVPAE